MGATLPCVPNSMSSPQLWPRCISGVTMQTNQSSPMSLCLLSTSTVFSVASIVDKFFFIALIEVSVVA